MIRIKSVLPRNLFPETETLDTSLPGRGRFDHTHCYANDRLKLIKLSILPGKPQDGCQDAEGWGVVGQKGAINLFSVGSRSATVSAGLLSV